MKKIICTLFLHVLLIKCNCRQNEKLKNISKNYKEHIENEIKVLSSNGFTKSHGAISIDENIYIYGSTVPYTSKYKNAMLLNIDTMNNVKNWDFLIQNIKGDNKILTALVNQNKTIVLGGYTYNENTKNIFIGKLKNNNLKWIKTFGATTEDSATDIIKTSNNKTIILGSIFNDIFKVVLNENSEITELRIIDSRNIQSGCKILESKKNNFLILGQETISKTNEKRNIIFYHLNSSKIILKKTLLSEFNLYPKILLKLSQHEYIFGGNFFSNNKKKIFMGKLTNNFTLSWMKSFYSPNNVSINNGLILNATNIMFIGTFNGFNNSILLITMNEKGDLLMSNSISSIEENLEGISLVKNKDNKINLIVNGKKTILTMPYEFTTKSDCIQKSIINFTEDRLDNNIVEINKNDTVLGNNLITVSLSNIHDLDNVFIKNVIKHNNHYKCVTSTKSPFEQSIYNTSKEQQNNTSDDTTDSKIFTNGNNVKIILIATVITFVFFTICFLLLKLLLKKYRISIKNKKKIEENLKNIEENKKFKEFKNKRKNQSINISYDSVPEGFSEEGQSYRTNSNKITMNKNNQNIENFDNINQLESFEKKLQDSENIKDEIINSIIAEIEKPNLQQTTHG